MESGELFHNAHFGKFESTLVLDPRSEHPPDSPLVPNAPTESQGFHGNRNQIKLIQESLSMDDELKFPKISVAGALLFSVFARVRLSSPKFPFFGLGKFERERSLVARRQFLRP
jgi:hypothetical protein